jgi:hypothetical protein
VPAHPSCDVYALGKVLTFLLTGQTDPDAIPWPSWKRLALDCTSREPAARPAVLQLQERLSRLPGRGEGRAWARWQMRSSTRSNELDATPKRPPRFEVLSREPREATWVLHVRPAEEPPWFGPVPVHLVLQWLAIQQGSEGSRLRSLRLGSGVRCLLTTREKDARQ